jgi:beta-glucanase (GH16 family)
MLNSLDRFVATLFPQRARIQGRPGALLDAAPAETCHSHPKERTMTTDPGPIVPPNSTSFSGDHLRLLWHDEFDGPAGAPPDPAKWGYDLGGKGWGNQEYQFYTDDPRNAALDGDSCLKIVARQTDEQQRAELHCWYGPARYTSARLRTQGKFAFTYGVIEARIRVPFGQGIWPALWMLGEDFGPVAWPHCGEIDIMENIGREPGIVHGTIHGPGYCGGEGIGGGFSLPEGQALSDAFHLYSVEWLPGIIRWYLDGQQYFEARREQIPAGAPWPFDHPFFLLLNLAVGGFWPGDPDETTVLPQILLVDYVRVFQVR